MSLNYKGDFLQNQLIDSLFHTKAPSTEVPTTLLGSPSVVIYKANSLAPTSVGVSLIVDFNGVVGLNHVRVLTTDA